MLGSSRRYIFTASEIVLAFVVLALTSGAVYTVLWWIDFGRHARMITPWDLITAPGAVNTLSNLGEVTLAVLSLALTVVTIIVELASNRYTPRITELFIRDPINGVMMSFYAVTAVVILWVEMSLYTTHYPTAMVVVALAAMTTSLLSVLPYFAYVFDFLMPTRVVQRIQQRSTSAVKAVTRRGESAIHTGRVEVLTATEQLGDMALNSVSSKDKGIAIAAIGALADLATAHLEMKSKLPTKWFETSALVSGDQDFIAMHPEVVRSLEARRTWVEMKVLRQFQAVFEESLLKMKDICHLVAIRTRQLAVTAAENGDVDGVRIAVRFLNTYMRATLNAGDQKSAYNLMNEYRMLGESLIATRKGEETIEIAQRCKFYGQLAFRMKLPFILETAAYDLCALLERAHSAKAPCHDALLEIFLDVDRPAEDVQTEASLRGVRKAQTKLATHYLLVGDEPHARRIFEDMKHEPPQRLKSIRAELLSTTEAEFWEVSDRGGNFDWLPPDRRAKLDQFFGWFEMTTTQH